MGNCISLILHRDYERQKTLVYEFSYDGMHCNNIVGFYGLSSYPEFRISEGVIKYEASKKFPCTVEYEIICPSDVILIAKLDHSGFIYRKVHEGTYRAKENLVMSYADTLTLFLYYITNPPPYIEVTLNITRG